MKGNSTMNLFEKYIKEKNIDIKLIQTDETTKTAQDAANTHNVPVSNIVKSLLVKIDDHFEIHLVPGDRRLDLERIGGRMATAEEVKEITGYSIGGIPPFGHKTKIKTYIEEGFDSNKTLLAAGGKPNIIFKISLEELKRLI